MCRIAAFPPGFSKSEAVKILANFENKNTDGTGSVYLKDGKFVVDKWAKPFSQIVKTKPNFLSHMPYSDSWTLVHLRAASHGGNSQQNTHPFLVGNWAFIHNGIWSEHNLVRLAISNQVTMTGETDSEVAAHFWNIVGPKKFAETVEFGGVFMGLHRNGKLWVAKTSGDLEIKALKHHRIVLASEFDHQVYEKTVDALKGWYQFSKDGCYVSHKENRSRWSSEYPYRGSASSSGTAYESSFGGSGRSSDYIGNNQHTTCYGGCGD